MSSIALESRPQPTPFIREPSLDALAHIPGTEGWPVLGSTLQLLADPKGETERLAEKYGPVFRTRAFGGRSVTLLGPEANEFVLFDQARTFSSSHGWGLILDKLFPRGLMLLDFDEHRLHRKALSVAFKTGPMKSYLASLDRGIVEGLAGWRARGPDMLFYPAVKQLTLDLAAVSFLGENIGANVENVKRAFVDMVAAAVSVIRKPLPFTQMAKGVAGRQFMIDYFGGQIDARRRGETDDLFSHLCKATTDDGSLLTRQEIIDHMSFLMMAAHDTLTSSLTSFVWFLASHPDWQQKLREEIAGLGLARDEPLPYERLDDLPLTEMAFKEALRLTPPVPSMPRRALRDFEFGGYHIPAGTGVGINVHWTHHNPEYWPEPEIFDPLRFTREAEKARHKYAWVPFGGGAHMCLGLHFAYMQVKVLMVQMLTRYRIAMDAGAGHDWQPWPIPKPRDGLRVVLTPL